MSTKQKSLAAYIVLVAIMSTACFKSKIVTKRVPTGPPAAKNSLKINGVTYALPRTVVKVDVPVTMTIETAGELQRFAPCFFSAEVASRRITEAGRSFSIEPATFSTRGEPDPDQHFIVKTKGGYFEHKSMLLEYTPEGVLTKGEAESKDESLEFAVATAKTIISIGAKAAAPGAGLADTSDGTKPELIKVGLQACRGVIASERAGLALKAVQAAAKAAPGAMAFVVPTETAANNAKADAARAVQEFSNLKSGLTTDAEKAEEAAQTAADDAIVDADSARTPTTNAAAAATAAGAAAEAAAATDAEKKLSELLAELGRPNPLVRCPCPPPPAPAARTAGQPGARFTSDYVRAVRVNEAIERLQAQREDLVSGGGSGGGFPAGTMAPDTLKLMLKETDDTITAYQDTYFLGTSTERSWTGPFEFTPATAPPAPAAPASFVSGTFFWFNEDEGLCEGPVADALGIKIPKKFKLKGGCAAPPAGSVAVTLRLQRKSDDDGFLTNLNAAHIADETRDGERGFYYRVPAKAGAILQAGADALSRSDVIVAQFGVVASLPASSSGRTTQYTIALDDSTGALKNFKLGSDALLQKSILDDAATAANSVIDAKKAKEKAKAEASDVLAQKKRELELLQTQNAINEEKKKAQSSGPQD